MRVLLTGHTGFKGSWLTLMLHKLGHEVHGISLDPIPDGIFELSKLSEICASDIRSDIRNKNSLDDTFARIQPEIVFHLAAQPLVLTSYNQIYETYSTNVSGTLNVLDSATRSKSLKGIIVITTDKVYLNEETSRAFVESDILGGKDPYSSSKALADQLTQNWGRHNPQIPLGIARAGNVIGGGDASANRLIPDMVMALAKGLAPTIRNPASVRPWQHVMDCLNGYLALMRFVLNGNSGIFNFGPNGNDFHTVEEVVTYFLHSYNLNKWVRGELNQGKEAGFLTLNSSKAMRELNWNNRLSFTQGLDLTINWHKAAGTGENMQRFTLDQIESFGLN